MTPTVHLEPMQRRHVDAVRLLDQAAYPNPWSAATWRNELASPDRLHLVAVDDEVVVGHAGLLFVLEEAHVTTVAVELAREGEGIASELLVALLGEARRRGSTAATLEVRSADRRPQRLYSRFGFQPVGTRRGYYARPDDDAIVMWLHDLAGSAAIARIDEVASELNSARSGDLP